MADALPSDTLSVMVNPGSAYPSLDEMVNEVADLRPLSAVASRVLQITEDERFSAHELAQVVATDQALSAKILRLSNSAYYGFPRRISTVRDAVVLLGFRAVRSATLASCVIDAMTGTTTLNYRDFWHFSVTVGMMAEMLAAATKTRQEEAFTAGVMHNVGRLALDQRYPEALRHSLAHARANQMELVEAEREILGFGDDELGGALALHWSFPESLVEAVATHSLREDELPDRDSLSAHVIRARVFARSCGLPDGIERFKGTAPPQEWTVPPLSVSLDRSGGVEGVLERASVFLETALVH